MTSSIDSFLTGTNATYIAELYSRYLKNPSSVDNSWQAFFADLGDDNRTVLNELRGAAWAPSAGGVVGCSFDDDEPSAAPSFPSVIRPESGGGKEAARDSIRALMMIRTYRVRGHLIADFDPLGLAGNADHSELDPRTYGFEEADMDRPIFIDHALGMETATPREILHVLKQTYCGSIGAEYMHIQEPDERKWIQDRIESIRNQTHFTVKGRKAIYERLVEAEGFEKFLNIKYPGTKRFGLDGGESLIPALEQILKRGSQLGVKEVVLGMPHRGRLNVLTSVMCKPFVAMFAEFKGVSSKPDDVEGSGDVKYHMGTSADRTFDGNMIHLSLTANPSHLEAVNPVVVGKVRAKQNLLGDEERSQVMGLLMHGDAAFAGQGLVPETLDLSGLRGYRTGGTIHFIVNNQIGFTAMPSKSRSSPYPSDIAKGGQTPIFHVNGDDPEAVVHVARIAAEFRQEFKRDVVIDMFCYRRHGHNEADEPMFTNPIMYSAIAKHPTTVEIYAKRLVADGVMTEEEAEAVADDFHKRLEGDFKAAESYKPNKADWLEGKWKGLVHSPGDEEYHEDDTSAPMELLKEVGMAISRPPENFNANPKILRQLENKRKMIESGDAIDWATAEALAFGTLMVEGTRVRLSGQDSGRGTFSQRHCVLVDQVNEERYFPLSNIREGQASFEVMDSPLSEAGVLGFEYGYSLSDPNTLVLWEAQFGDFANGAQMIIDQFIASGETKWLRMSSLVLLLPHGHEGQGPEHSSARMERYLQLCAEDNIQVVNITTPANYFHALRRQQRRNYRKPLVVMAPKSLLRHKLVVSKMGEMGPGTKFMRVLPEKDRLEDRSVRRVVLCSGKVYYDLLQERRDRGVSDVAIVRVEQLYPWPRRLVTQQLTRYHNAEVVWCQEEPANMGAWSFVQPRLNFILESLGGKIRKPVYAGRIASASPATGSAKAHAMEQTGLIEQALATNLDLIPQPFMPVCKKT
ncbi:MAG: 2-oxoglutarate dehydrogenase E1 component [Rhodospirillales bacterium RIFCSPLOWO2_12_FULL_58_28]|nr:MAG: 2-oxoglutarate dehydrogenase E1 component [Rhodospirillales bacterium RIFCSPLOWO2_02_FULL_58_16]OHC77196.1 MAG: 2-oxoglutarate dehydrogenase E1 component [Rhodospirillales bacterium RIFCSPLOWO2_12_FULL_58_28]